MLIGKFLDPKNDFAFKKIFGTEKNKDILIHFLNDMLDLDGEKKVRSVTFLQTSQDPDLAAKKQSLVDVLCVDEKGDQYIVEMQVAKTAGFEKRAQYYAAKAYARQLNQGDAYHRLKKIIFLAITDFVMFPDKVAYKSDHVILDKTEYTHDLKDFSFTFLELPKFTKSLHELHTMVEKWAYFFKHADETRDKDLAQFVGEDKIIERAYEELDKYSWSDIELNTYEREEKSDRDAQAILDAAIETALETGMAKGKSEEKLAVAKSMLSENMSVEIISKITGLDMNIIKLLGSGK